MRNHVEFLFDYASPWSYLASELLERQLSGIPIDYQPIYIRGLDAFGSRMPYSMGKMQYLLSDLMRCTAHHNVPLRFPSVFPVNGLYALRGALWTLEQGTFPTYHPAMFRAVWRDDRNISDKAVVIEVAGEAGIDVEAFAQGIEREDVKAGLKARTAAAAERGVFGVPSFYVGDDLFWGHDRMEYVARAVRE